MDQQNMFKVTNKLNDQLTDGEMATDNVNDEAISQLLPTYQLPINAKQDHIQEETRIIEQYINQEE